MTKTKLTMNPENVAKVIARRHGEPRLGWCSKYEKTVGSHSSCPYWTLRPIKIRLVKK